MHETVVPIFGGPHYQARGSLAQAPPNLVLYVVGDLLSIKC